MIIQPFASCLNWGFSLLGPFNSVIELNELKRRVFLHFAWKLGGSIMLRGCFYQDIEAGQSWWGAGWSQMQESTGISFVMLGSCRVISSILDFFFGWVKNCNEKWCPYVWFSAPWPCIVTCFLTALLLVWPKAVLSEILSQLLAFPARVRCCAVWPSEILGWRTSRARWSLHSVAWSSPLRWPKKCSVKRAVRGCERLALRVGLWCTL